MSTTISGTNGVTFPDSTSMQTGQQACKAWVNFNGVGTVAIRAAYNVSSITDSGTGEYTVNFTTAMPDANYSAAGFAGVLGVQNVSITQVQNNTGNIVIRVRQTYSDTSYDSSLVQIQVFR